MKKPTVHFIPPAEFFNHENEFTGNTYELARVYGLDHPRLGETTIRTSIILKKNKDGSFETLNTLYVPANDESLNKEDNTDVNKNTAE